MTKAHENVATLRCSVVLCGGPACGKTALVCQFASRGQDFPKTYKLTVGVELSIAEVELKESKTVVQLQMLDCGGNKAQLALVEESLGPGCNWCAIVYSVTDRASLDAAEEWYDMLLSRRSNPQVRLRGVLIATKTDLPLTRHEVTSEMGQKLADQKGLEFIETHATTFKDASKPFESLAKLFQQDYSDQVRLFETALVGR